MTGKTIRTRTGMMQRLMRHPLYLPIQEHIRLPAITITRHPPETSGLHQARRQFPLILLLRIIQRSIHHRQVRDLQVNHTVIPRHREQLQWLQVPVGRMRM